MRLSAFLARLRADRRGNILMIFGFALVPITFATGMAIDYGTAMRIQTDLNAAADAAALSATSLTMMDKPLADAEAQARIMFEAEAASMTGIVPFNFADPAQLQIRVTESSSQTDGYLRTATVTYRGQSRNSFAGILGTSTLTVQGTATAEASTAPDTDFYVMLDVSSSMALPTTTAGIDFLKSQTVREGNPDGCAFACHETNPDNPNIRNAKGKIIDYYTFAHANNIELRIDAGKSAVADVVTEAETEGRSNGAAYRFYLATFDRAANYRALTGATPSSDFANVRAKAATAQTVAIKKGSSNWSMQTEHGGSLAKLNAAITDNPGNGRHVPGDRPKAVLFLITDGMRNEYIDGQQMGAMTTDQCDAIKARGVRIAVLYTTYTAAAIDYDQWSINNAVGKLPDIAPALRTCASDNLFFEVSTDGNLSKALTTLFQQAIKTSRLTR
ncbi:hypothetical protein ASE59_04710 [Sphingomonas sp. Leaf10]|nr:hypothetical protein ASE59_04710 [Sphingomonas sp. Leaf10]